MKTIIAAVTLAVLSSQATAQVYYPQYVTPGGNDYGQRLDAETYRYEQSAAAQTKEMIQHSREAAQYRELHGEIDL